jgi:hypothetical protein
VPLRTFETLFSDDRAAVITEEPSSPESAARIQMTFFLNWSYTLFWVVQLSSRSLFHRANKINLVANESKSFLALWARKPFINAYQPSL